MARKRKAPLGASLVVIASIFYASYGIWTKLLGNFFDGFTLSVYRGILVVAILLPIACFSHSLQPLKLKNNWRYVTGMVFASALTWGPFYFAIIQAGIGISLTIQYAAIVIGQFLFGSLFARERLTKDKALSAALSFAGLALIFSPTTRSLGWLALIGATVSGLAAAANAVLSKQIDYNATQSTIVLWSSGIVANIVMTALLHKHYPTFRLGIRWLYLMCFATASLIASWTFVRGVKLIDVGAAGILGLLEIVFGVLFGVVFFHERPSPVVLLGVVMIIAAAAIPYSKDYNFQKGSLE